jgi:hypothetical protein
MVSNYWIEAFARDARPPTPAAQAVNLIARIGDAQSETGEGYFIDDVVDAPLVGAFSRAMFDSLLQEVIHRGQVKNSNSARSHILATPAYSAALFSG